MGEARLDRIASLAPSLKRWIANEDLSDGHLILAWTNLGSPMEGVINLFLCVYLADYRADDIVRQTRAFNAKKQVLQDPDGLTLEIIVRYADLAALFAAQEVAFARLTQARRNVIHTFLDRDIGTSADFRLRSAAFGRCSTHSTLDCLTLIGSTFPVRRPHCPEPLSRSFSDQHSS